MSKIQTRFHVEFPADVGASSADAGRFSEYNLSQLQHMNNLPGIRFGGSNQGSGSNRETIPGVYGWENIRRLRDLCVAFLTSNGEEKYGS